MPPVGFEPTTPAGERPQTHVLDREATGTGSELCGWLEYKNLLYMLKVVNNTTFV